MQDAKRYSFLFHVTLAAFVSGAAVGFFRPDFPKELTQLVSQLVKEAAVVPVNEEAPVVPAVEEAPLPMPLRPEPDAPAVRPDLLDAPPRIVPARGPEWLEIDTKFA
jgi:hypothetical protein